MRMKEVRLACQAMGTRFELLLYGDVASRLRAAGEEAVGEIRRLDAALSAFNAHSLVGRINARAAFEPVRVSAELFDLLTRVRFLSDITDGAFDVTVGPLMSKWGFRGGPERPPAQSEVAEALGRVGFSRVRLDSRDRTVCFGRDGMRLDLGGIGKGYALDVAKRALRSAGIGCALLHGGTSSVAAVGSDPEGRPWRVAVRRPFADRDDAALGFVALEDESLAVSAVSGRFFRNAGRVYGHVIDPRTGCPVRGADLAVVASPSAADADALSTALLVLGPERIATLKKRIDGFRGAVFRSTELADRTNRVALV